MCTCKSDQDGDSFKWHQTYTTTMSMLHAHTCRWNGQHHKYCPMVLATRQYTCDAGFRARLIYSIPSQPCSKEPCYNKNGILATRQYL